MSEARVADSKPKILELDAGTYFWCACGRSQNQPFCDGSHGGTGITPVQFEVADGAKPCAMCMCKKTAAQPFCDGTHSRI